MFFLVVEELYFNQFSVCLGKVKGGLGIKVQIKT